MAVVRRKVDVTDELFKAAKSWSCCAEEIPVQSCQRQTFFNKINWGVIPRTPLEKATVARGVVARGGEATTGSATSRYGRTLT